MSCAPGRGGAILATVKKTILPGVSYWSRYQADRGIDFSGFHWQREGGGVLVDPMEMSEFEAAALRERGGARWILLSNFDHLRATAQLKRACDAKVAAPAGERERFGPGAELVDTWFESQADLPEDLRESVDIHVLRGGKSAIEAAFFLRGPDALLFGDLVRSHVSGALCLLPEPKIADRAAVIESLRPLRDVPARAILLGDGDCLFRGAREALGELLDGLD